MKNFNFEHIQQYLVGGIIDYGEDSDQQGDGIKGWQKLNELTQEERFELVQQFASEFLCTQIDKSDEEVFSIHCYMDKNNKRDLSNEG